MKIKMLEILRTGCGSLLLLIGLAGCLPDTLASLNPLADTERAPGTRLDLFSEKDPLSQKNAENFSTQTIHLDPPRQMAAWKQSGGTKDNNPGNIVLALQGQEEWRLSLGEGGFGLRGDTKAYRISARPLVFGNRVYVYQQDGTVTALSLSGTPLWRQDVRPPQEMDVAVGGGISAGDTTVFVGTGYGEILALHAETGSILWRFRLPSPARGAPTLDAKRVYVLTQNNDVLAFDQKEGQMLWQSNGVPEIASVLSSAGPAIVDNVLIAPFSSGEVMALNAQTGALKWLDIVSDSYRHLSISGLGDVSAAPVVDKNTVYVTGVGGHTAALNLTDGKRLWEQRIGSLYTPVVSGNALFMIDLQQRLVALERTSGKPLWVTPLPVAKTGKKDQTSWIGPLLLNETLWVFSDTGLFLQVEAKTGSILGQKPVNQPIYVLPVVAQGRLVSILGNNDLGSFQ